MEIPKSVRTVRNSDAMVAGDNGFERFVCGIGS